MPLALFGASSRSCSKCHVCSRSRFTAFGQGGHHHPTNGFQTGGDARTLSTLFRFVSGGEDAHVQQLSDLVRTHLNASRGSTTTSCRVI